MKIIAQGAALKRLPARSQLIFNNRFTGELVQSGESVVEEPLRSEVCATSGISTMLGSAAGSDCEAPLTSLT